MSFITQKPDFITELRYLTTEEGGRKTEANNGYRPQVKFEVSDMTTSGQQIFIDRNSVNPADTVTAEIKILSPVFFENMLTIGMSFEMRVGKKLFQMEN